MARLDERGERRAACGRRSYPGSIAYLMRRQVEDGVEFVTLTLFDSIAAVRSFAGEDYERAVVPPIARRLLSRFDERSRHYEVAVQSG